MHSDIYELICFRLGLMIHGTELYIFILIFVTLTFIQDHRDARKQRLSICYLPKLWMDLDDILESC